MDTKELNSALGLFMERNASYFDSEQFAMDFPEPFYNRDNIKSFLIIRIGQPSGKSIVAPNTKLPIGLQSDLRRILQAH